MIPLMDKACASSYVIKLYVGFETSISNRVSLLTSAVGVTAKVNYSLSQHPPSDNGHRKTTLSIVTSI
jgi:hypothetical protein